jgi:hypothetical protein
MVLLSGLMRTTAVTGTPGTVFTRATARQGGRWAEQRVQAAVARAPSGEGVPAAAAPALPDPAASLR